MTSEQLRQSLTNETTSLVRNSKKIGCMEITIRIIKNIPQDIPQSILGEVFDIVKGEQELYLKELDNN